MNAQTGFGALRFKRYLSLETYRKNGKGVRTPVWFVVAPARGDTAAEPTIYVYTTADSGKAQRIRNRGAARIAAAAHLGASGAPGLMCVWRSSRARRQNLGCGLSTGSIFP